MPTLVKANIPDHHAMVPSRAWGNLLRTDGSCPSGAGQITTASALGSTDGVQPPLTLRMLTASSLYLLKQISFLLFEFMLGYNMLEPDNHKLVLPIAAWR